MYRHSSQVSTWSSSGAYRLDADTAEWRGCQCKRFSCEQCGPGIRKRRFAQSMSGAPTRFVTLTRNPETAGSRIDRARCLKVGWQQYVRWHRRKNGPRSIEYRVVIEQHRDGELHAHVLIRSTFINKNELRRCMTRAGAGFVKIQYLKGPVDRAARYCSKYMTKQQIAIPRLRTCWQSRGYALKKWERPARPWIASDQWRATPGGKAIALAHFAMLGYVVVVNKENYALAIRAPPDVAALAAVA